MPSTPSAERDHRSGLGTDEADRGFLARRRRQILAPTRRDLALAIAGGVTLVALLGAIVGPTPRYGTIAEDAEAMRSAGKLTGERGGSQCVGWPPALTISTRPSTVAPDRVVVYLSQKGWTFAMGDDLVEAGARVVLRSPTARFRASDPLPTSAQVMAKDGDGAVISMAAPAPPSDGPMVNTSCAVESVTVEVQGRDGEVLDAEVLELVNGSHPGNPVTFERRTS